MHRLFACTLILTLLLVKLYNYQIRSQRFVEHQQRF